MIHRRDLSKAAARDRVPEKSVEKDYAIHWLMAGLAQTGLHARLAFKGGTALRLCRFEGYRYSEDIDLTAAGAIDTTAAFAAFGEVGAWVREKSAIHLDVVETSVEAREDSFSFEVGYTGPLGGDAGSRSIKVDLSTHEKVLFPIAELPLMPHYADLPADVRIRCYSLEEVVVEKFRSLLNPARREPRDVYDLWHLAEKSPVRAEELGAAFREKSAFKNLDPETLLATMVKKEKALRSLWKSRLANQVADLPQFEGAFRIVQREAKKLLS
jgi:hypothetical protein